MENTSPSASASRSMTDKGGAPNASPNGRPSVVDGYNPSAQPNTMGMTHQNRMGMVKSSAELHDYHMDGLAHSTQSPSDTGSSALLGLNDTVSSRSSPPNLLIDHNPSDLEQPSTPPLDLSRTAKTSTRPRTAHLTATTRNTSMKSSSPTTSAPTSASVQVGPVHEHARMLLAYMQSASIHPTSLQQACKLVASMQPHVIQEMCKQLAAMQSISIQQAGMQLASMQLSMQPFSMQPSSSLQPSMQPASMQPAFEQPASRQPAPMQLGSIPRSSVQPFSMQPSSMQPASVQLTSMQTSTMQPVSMQRASMQPAYIQRASMEAAGERDVEGYDYAKYLESQPKYSLVLRNRNKSRLEGEEEWLKKIEEENVYLRALFQQQWDVKERLLFHLCYHYGRKYTPKKAPSISSIMQRASMQPASMQPASMQPASMQPGSMETASAENVEGQKDPKYSEN